jgi:hypothetical protein
MMKDIKWKEGIKNELLLNGQMTWTIFVVEFIHQRHFNNLINPRYIEGYR